MGSDRSAMGPEMDVTDARQSGSSFPPCALFLGVLSGIENVGDMSHLL